MPLWTGTKPLGGVCILVAKHASYRGVTGLPRSAHKFGPKLHQELPGRRKGNRNAPEALAAAAGMKVVVVGAGFAGLGAARRLAEAGWDDVIVLEGGGRVGGRAHTAELPGCGRVEMGATWLHGLEGNPLYAYAVEHGLMSPAAKQQDEEWGSSQWVRQGAAEPLNPEEAQTAKSAAGAYSMAVEDSLHAEDAGYTVGQHLRSAWPQVRDRFEPGQRQLVSEVWSWREALQRSMDGCTTTDDMLARGLAQYDELDELNVPVPGGFQTLAQHMATGLDIRFHANVTHIEWSAAGVTVTCNDGRTFDCDALIWTASLGVLKASHTSLFSPPLPPQKAAAIDRMGFGVINKIFIRSTAALPQQPPQQHKARAFSLLWSLPDPESWAEQPEDAAEAEKSWLRGAYALRMKGSEFVRLDPKYRSAAATAQPGDADAAEPGASGSAAGQAATAWIAGPEALAMEARSDDQLAADAEALLNAFPPAKRQLGGVQQALRSTWGTDPLFRGSYSYIAGGSSPEHVAVLGTPLSSGGRPVLLFAGEATHASHFGTAHGALISGRREADRLQALTS